MLDKLEELADEWFDNDGKQMELLSAMLGQGLEVEGVNGEKFNIPITRTIAQALSKLSTAGLFDKSPKDKLQQMIAAGVISSADAKQLQSDTKLMRDLEERTFRGNSESNLIPSLMSLPKMTEQESIASKAKTRERYATVLRESQNELALEQNRLQRTEQSIAQLKELAANVGTDEDGVADRDYSGDFKELERERKDIIAGVKRLEKEAKAADDKLRKFR